MAFVAIPDAWEVTYEGDYSTSLRRWDMVWGMKDTASHDNARAVVIASAWKDIWHNGLRDLCVNDCRLTGIRVTDMESETGVSIHYATGLPETGTQTGDPAGGQVAPIVSLLSGARGRANRGRKYFPGCPDTYINANDGCTLDAGVADSYRDQVLAVITAVHAISGGPDLAILSRSQALAVPVLAVQARSYLGTQRRRVRP